VAVSNGGGAYKSVTLLGDLSDVSIASPAANNGLVWSGTYWINNPVVLSLNGATGAVTIVAGNGAQVNTAGTTVTVAVVDNWLPFIWG
jgi:phage tail tape-measure protein